MERLGRGKKREPELCGRKRAASVRQAERRAERQAERQGKLQLKFDLGDGG